MRTRLYDPRKGEPGVTLERFVWNDSPRDPDRTNCFSIYWVASGGGTMEVDLATHRFASHSLLFVSPYRRVRVTPDRTVRGVVVRFHANFLCVETFHAESGCSGALFNDPFGSPAVRVPGTARDDVRRLIDRVADELHTPREGSREVVTASLKILLVMATRLKHAATPPHAITGDHRHPMLQQVTDLLEQHYRRLHAPADYARLLRITPKALARFARVHFGRTMTEVIRERLLIDAKWELLHTLKPVKQVAGELGFSDELYFSRFFRKATGQSPTAFRAFETEIRGGSNLSMSLSRPAIPGPRPLGGA